MSRRILVVGMPAELQARIVSVLDACFDVDIERCPDALDAMRLLPNRSVDLFVILALGATAPGIDLVRIVREHALHVGAPVLFVGGSPDERRRALALGARLLPGDVGDDDIQRATREELGLG